MVFHCHHDFSLDTKCEWTFLTSFVAQYNKEHKTDFQRFRCLDVELRNTAQPEVLLVDSSNGNTMVIERKSIVWPSIYIADHKAWHRKAERLAKANNGYFEEFLPWDDPEKLMGQRKDAVQGFSQAFGSTLPVVADKLRKWPHAIRIYVVQFIGEADCIADDDVERIVREADMPPEIDQVWGACHEWQNEEEYRVAWRQMR